MKKYTTLLFIMFLLIVIKSAKAQDPIFTSFMNNPLYYNPAAPGIKTGNEFHLNYREQWPGIVGGNRAFSYSSLHSFCNNFSLGVLAKSNIEGESKLMTNNVGLSVAVPVRLSKHFRLSTGITSSYGQKRIDWSELDFDDEYDKLYGKIYETGFSFPSSSRKNYGDLSLGMALQGTSKQNPFGGRVTGVLGAGIHHVAVFPNPNFIGTDIKAVPLKEVYHLDLWFLHGSGKRKRGFSPAIMYESQDPLETFNFSFSYLMNNIYVVGSFRNRNYKFAFDNYDSFNLGFGYLSNTNPYSKKTIKFGYSYDFTISKLAGGTWGTHEIFIVYNISGCNSLSAIFGGKSRGKGNVKRPDKECEEFQYTW